MNKKYTVNLSDNEREDLEYIIGRGHNAAYKIKYAYILLKVDETSHGWTDEKAAEAFSAHKSTVADVRRRFTEQGLEAALERKTKVHGRRVWPEKAEITSLQDG